MVGLRAFLLWLARASRRIAVTIVGMLLLFLGVVMLITPGPGWLTIFAGLGLLGTEYAWARRALAAAKRRAAGAANRVRRTAHRKRKGSDPEAASAPTMVQWGEEGSKPELGQEPLDGASGQDDEVPDPGDEARAAEG